MQPLSTKPKKNKRASRKLGQLDTSSNYFYSSSAQFPKKRKVRPYKPYSCKRTSKNLFYKTITLANGTKVRQMSFGRHSGTLSKGKRKQLSSTEYPFRKDNASTNFMSSTNYNTNSSQN